MPSQSIAPRLKELRDDGLIARTDVKRPTRRGRGAFVETITPLALSLDRLATDGATRAAATNGPGRSDVGGEHDA